MMLWKGHDAAWRPCLDKLGSVSRDKESVRRGLDKPFRAQIDGNDVIELNPTFPGCDLVQLLNSVQRILVCRGLVSKRQ